jgi:hypothetical protein
MEENMETDFQNFLEAYGINIISYEKLKILPNPIKTRNHKIYKGFLDNKPVVIKHLYTIRNSYDGSYYRMLKLSLEYKILFDYSLFAKFYGLSKTIAIINT